MRGINQIQVKPQIGLTFASLLRSILRQDPDVIMVGEIRDLETAQIAVQAALTGHLVLSTLHTNSAAAAVTRLRDMGVEDYLLTAVLRGVLAQRLVRRLCPHCRHAGAGAARAGRAVRARNSGQCRRAAGQSCCSHPVGCPACRQTGYRGRAAIAEFLAPDAGDRAADLLPRRPRHDRARRRRRRHGDDVRRRAGRGAGRRDDDRGSGPQHPRRGLSDAAFRYTAIGAGRRTAAARRDGGGDGEPR